ncbi:hypothetical protein J6590_094364, partial [Homalodisca vitripennis]
MCGCKQSPYDSGVDPPLPPDLATASRYHIYLLRLITVCGCKQSMYDSGVEPPRPVDLAAASRYHIYLLRSIPVCGCKQSMYDSEVDKPLPADLDTPLGIIFICYDRFLCVAASSLWTTV